uniref:Semaphorin-2A n=1 Tax=Chelonoidis abingdonii TaxID=106734 RepID=A0A8C0GN24_CHEAB
MQLHCCWQQYDPPSVSRAPGLHYSLCHWSCWHSCTTARKVGTKCPVLDTPSSCKLGESPFHINCLYFPFLQEECQNYVRVLIVYGKKVFTCGTNAFSPVCSSRQVGNVSKTIDKINGVARCPYDPRHNSTAVITSRGELYAATVIDFSGRDPAIYRSLGKVPPLRTAQYNSKWLNEPNFIAAYDIGLFTYFFFRENAVEHDCGKTVYSRVARVCKNDIGGRFLLEDTWTTFMKARLNCSRSGEIPFYYNELQSTFYLPEQDLIYGVFTTNVNSIAASAVCAFNLSAITQAFNGTFRYQENPRSAWLPTINPIPNFQCGTLNDNSPNENLTERILQDAQRLFLMNDVVQPVSVDPYVTQDSIRFSKLVVDIVQGKDTLYHVMYIGTEYGTILKALSTTNRSLRSCYLEEMHILPNGQQEPIKSLQILHSDRSLFVGLNNGVLKIPLERCSGLLWGIMGLNPVWAGGPSLAIGTAHKAPSWRRCLQLAQTHCLNQKSSKQLGEFLASSYIRSAILPHS